MTAASAGSSTDDTARRLRTLQGRGVCAQTAAVMAASLQQTWTRRVVLGHWACPPPARRAAGGERSAPMRAAAAHPVTAASRTRAAAGAMSTHRAMTKTMKDPNCPPAVLRGLAPSGPDTGLSNSDRYGAAIHAVSHPAAPLDLLWRAAHSRGLRHSAAQHPRCPPQALRMLSQTTEMFHLAVAANPACPPEVLAGLVTDHSDMRIRSAAIANPSLPAAVLAAVSDPAATISDAVRAASNPNSGSGLARRLAASDHASVAAAAALIATCPTDVLENLATYSGEALLLDAVAAHAACPVDVLANAARCRWASTAKAAAANPICPPEALRVAARRREDSCRGAAAANLNCPPEMLSKLLGDSVPYVAQAAAANPNCPNSALIHAARLGTSTITNAAVAALRSRMRVRPGADPGPDV